MTIVINRRERKRVALRAQILSTGIDLFSRHGVGAVTIDEIAAAADVGKGTVYNYFSTKEDIVVAFMADLEARLAPKVARFAPGNRPLHRILADYILLHFRLKQPYHAFVRVFLAQMFLDTERFIPYMLEMQKYIDPPLQSLFTMLQDRGLLCVDIDLAQLIMSFKTMHLGLTALWAVEGPPFRQTVQTVRQQMQFLSEGIMRKQQ
jgi:TetR/AcrR family transcriptional regulator of autoinduction and epiphytic fitness